MDTARSLFAFTRRAPARPEARLQRTAPAFRVLSTEIVRARRCRDFGRVEARVQILFQEHANMPPKMTEVLTNAPTSAGRIPGRLRQRLLRDAVALAILTRTRVEEPRQMIA
jgi:hypothetical protein